MPQYQRVQFRQHRQQNLHQLPVRAQVPHHCRPLLAGVKVRGHRPHSHKGQLQFLHQDSKPLHRLLRKKHPVQARVKKVSIAPNKMLFSAKKYYFFLFLHKNICSGYSIEALIEALLMSTHNICFHGEIRKIFTYYPLLSRAMGKILIVFT